MKLSDAKIYEIFGKFSYLSNEFCSEGESVVCEGNFGPLAEAIEAACQPKWLPMESAQRIVDKPIMLMTKGKYVIIGEYHHTYRDGQDSWVCDSGENYFGTSDFIGWMPLPEVE